MDKLQLFSIVCLIFSLGSLIYGYYKVDSIEKDYKERFDTYSMCNLTLSEDNFGINGIYFSDRYYCIWTKGRSEVEMRETEVHEQCHDYVYDEYEHFCGSDAN